MEIKTAIIAGATGLVGSYCLNELLESEIYSSVISLVRRPAEISNPKLTQVVIDFDALEQKKDLLQGDDIFCCLGTTIKKAGSKEAFRKVDVDYPFRLAKIALANGAKQYSIISAVGADPSSKVFYNRMKGEAEKIISELDYEAINIFRPSLLLGDRDEFRFGEEIGKKIMRPLSFLFIGPLKKYKPVHAKNVAAAMVFSAEEELSGVNIFESNEIEEIYEEIN